MIRFRGKIRSLGLAALLGLVSTGVGCAGERDPIDRVQPNAMSKHFFVGEDLKVADDDPEFFWRNYVVDASASQSLIGVGSWGHVDRIRWEITEDMLIGRKAYQIADGQDDKGLTKTPNGTIIAAYKIQSHFDIRRSYNPSTGEENNIVEENTTDRAWNDREYMRVDWSQNLVGQDNPMWSEMFTAKVFGEFTILPSSYAVTDPNSDDALHIDPEQGYLDVTNKYTLTPAQTQFGDSKVPTCMVVGIYTGSSTYECDPQEATVRSSFLRIDPNRDFESLDNTKATMDVVGNPGGIGNSRDVGVVGAGRQGYDPQYGFTDALYHRYAYIHNVWKKSHTDQACTSNDDTDKDGTADACSAVTGSHGSQCDMAVKKCTIPLRDREIKSIGYWVNKEAPDALQDPVADGKPTGRGTLEDLIYSWNQLMKVAIATSREVECRRTGDGNRDTCHASFFDSTSDPGTKEMVSYGGWLVEKAKDAKAAVTFCHNPVRAYDDQETCGKEGYRARVGDIRHNFIFYWPYESRAPWGGIANWNADPLTGEIIGGAAQIMGRSATYAAAQQRDILQIAMGDTTIEQIMDGTPAQTFSKSLIDGHAPKALTPEQMKNKVDAIDMTHLTQSLGSQPWSGADRGAKLRAETLDKKTATGSVIESSTALLEYTELAKNLRGTKYESQLVDSHWMVGAMGADPSSAVSDATLDVASPLRGMDPGRQRMMRELATAGLQERGVCFLDQEAPAGTGSVLITSLAGWFKNKYANLDPVERGKRIYDDLWKESVKGIALHEIGHSLGLLHEFASSWDSPNYNPQYWQLRTNEGKSTASCNGKARGDDDTCMGPRYLDPESADEQGLAGESRPGILYFANTSTMEYQIERAGETVGLGTYDQHAMKALYGRVLETIDPRVMATDEQQDIRFKNWTQLTDRDLIIDGTSLTAKHYTETARKMKVFDPKRDCRPATDEEKATANWRIVHGKVCSPPPKDHWAWTDFKSDSLYNDDPQYNAPYWHVVDKDNKNRVRWPYRWGTTHNSYFHTNDSDAGADPYEVTVNTARKFEQNYPWAYFRRHNREYNYTTVPSAVADRYFERMRAYHWLVATDLARGADAAALNDDDDLRPIAMAQGEMFDFLTRAVLMPEPGDYFSPDASNDVFLRQPVDTTKAIYDTGAPSGLSSIPKFNIGIGAGRYIGEEFDNDIGGSWDYLSFIKHAGFSVEKGLALQTLVDGRPTLFTISRQNFLDPRGVKVNFRNDLPQAIDRLLGGILAEDWESVAPGFTDATGPVGIDLTGRTVAPKRNTDARILFPNIGYKSQLSAAVYTALFSRLNTDLTLVNKMRVFIDGQVGQVTLPDDQQVKFSDPSSGYTYVARKYGTEMIDQKMVERGIASRMLSHANAMTAAAYDVERDAVTTKPVLDAYGRPKLKLDASGQPVVKDATIAGQLGQYVGLVDALREIEGKLGYGPLGGSSQDD